jgi:hypothetical protein
MFKRLFGVCLTFGMAATAPPVLAATSACALREDVVQRLQSKYSEELTVGGLQKSRETRTVMEIWASDRTGTFTVLITKPNGVSCIVAAGTDFFQAEHRAAAPEDTAS